MQDTAGAFTFTINHLKQSQHSIIKKVAYVFQNTYTTFSKVFLTPNIRKRKIHIMETKELAMMQLPNLR